MEPVRIDLTINQGMPFKQALRPMAKNPTTGNLEPVNYTGYTATFTIYPAPATLESLHQYTPVYSTTSASGAIDLGLFDDDEFGQYGIYVYLTQGITSAMEPWGMGVYNLDIIDSFGHPQLRFAGAISLEEGTKHE